MELNQDMLLQWGLISKLSTGSSLLDALLVMLLPLVFSHLTPLVQTAVERWKARRSRSDQQSRDIEFTFKKDTYWDYDKDEAPNHKLQAAILVHMNRLPGFHSKLEAANVQLVRAGGGGKQRGAAGCVSLSSDDSDDDGTASCADSGSSSSNSSDYHWYPDMELESFEIKMMPPLDTWIDIENGLRFRRSSTTAQTGSNDRSSTNANGGVETTVTFSFVGRAQQIDAFIAAAYDSYRATLKGERKKAEEERFLYLPVMDGADGAREGNFTFRRYKLSDERGFDNLFHPEKEAILSLVEAFVNRTGKFGIRGYPQKLGFLLHGPPGTGKTTFIKSLAAHTKRSIISLPLSRIQTNQQLMSLMMDQRVRVEGEEHTMPLPHSKVVYVCEDVDAASHVVQRRAEPDAVAATLASLMQKRGGGAAAAAGGRSKDKGAGDTWEWVDGAVVDRNIQVEVGGIGPSRPAGTIKAPRLLGLTGGGAGGGDDALNLAGLLNVLDGVVDTPGRLLVLSSNHPEKLDPALIRPGRINRKVYMGHIAAQEALQMVSHYFGPLQPAQKASLVAMWPEGVVSPAALEALCAECEDVPSLLQAAELLVGLSAQAAQAPAPQGGSTSAAAAATTAGPSGCLQEAGSLSHAPEGSEGQEEAAADMVPADQQAGSSSTHRASSSPFGCGPVSLQASGQGTHNEAAAPAGNEAGDGPDVQAEGLDAAAPVQAKDTAEQSPTSTRLQRGGGGKAGGGGGGKAGATRDKSRAALSGGVLMGRAGSCGASVGGVIDIAAVTDGIGRGMCRVGSAAVGG